MRKKFVVFATCVVLVTALTACNNETTENTEQSSEEAVKLSDVSQMENFVVEYKDTDEVPDWETENTEIVLKGDAVEISGKGAACKNSVITITKPGYYVFSGELSDGKVVIDADEKDKVYLILNGVTMSCSNDAVIHETKADKVIITAVAGTENILSDGSTHSNEEITAAVYCKDSLTINGTGSLKVSGNFNDGITTKDKFKLIDTTLEVTSVDDGIVGKDLVAIKSGNVNINSTGDGIKSTKTTDIEEGIVCIDGGTLNIVSELDGIQAENYVKINDGVIKITTGGGSDNESSGESQASPFASDSSADTLSGTGGKVQLLGDTQSSDFEKSEEKSPSDQNQEPPQNGDNMQPPEDGNMPDKRGGGRELETDENGNAIKPEMPTNENGEMEQPEKGDGNFGKGDNTKRDDWGNWGGRGGNMEEENTSKDADAPSAKGMKGGNGVYIAGGTINIDSSDDSIHANDMIYIRGGEICLASGDDGVHADTTLDIAGGTIDITKSYEGLEAYYIHITNGEISVVSRDDGLNAAGGNDSSSTNGRMGQNNFSDESSDASISISGGTLKVTASGDGIDSNGSITMDDGSVTVCGPESGGNGILDYADKFTMNGGTLMGAGTSGMFQSISSGSKLSVINAKSISGSKGDEIKIYDGEQEIASFTAETSYQAVIVSTPDLKAGNSYTIKYGDNETTVEAQEAQDYAGR